MEDLGRRGAGIIMISSDMPEVLHMSDRILVVREGQIAGELQRDKATQESILRLAVGSEGFVNKVKKELGYQARGRPILRNEGEFELRESISPYRADFDTKKGPVSPKKGHYF